MFIGLHRETLASGCGRVHSHIQGPHCSCDFGCFQHNWDRSVDCIDGWHSEIVECQLRHMCPHLASRPQAYSCEHCFVSRRTYGPHNLSVQHHCMESADGHACVGCPRLTGVLPQACKLLTKRRLALYMHISPKCRTPLDNSLYASKISPLGRAYWGGSLRFVLTGQFAHGHREP